MTGKLEDQGSKEESNKDFYIQPSQRLYPVVPTQKTRFLHEILWNNGAHLI